MCFLKKRNCRSSIIRHKVRPGFLLRTCKRFCVFRSNGQCIFHSQRQKIDCVFPKEQSLCLIREYPIKPYIPRIWRNLLDFLALKGDAEQLWANPVLAMFQKRKTSVVVSAAHAYPVPVLVECDRRCNDEFEFLRSEQKAACWLPGTKAVLLKFRIWENFAKDHFGPIAQNRDENALVCAPGTLDNFTCIDFVVHRQVTADQ